MIAWLASPSGWLTVSWLTLYYGMTISGLYLPSMAIAFSGTLSLMSTILIFGSDLDLN